MVERRHSSRSGASIWHPLAPWAVSRGQHCWNVIAIIGIFHNRYVRNLMLAACATDPAHNATIATSSSNIIRLDDVIVVIWVAMCCVYWANTIRQGERNWKCWWLQAPRTLCWMIARLSAALRFYMAVLHCVVVSVFFSVFHWAIGRQHAATRPQVLWFESR